MYLIADSGSTKTDWRLINQQGEITQLSSEGLNPFFHNDESIKKVLNSTFNAVDTPLIRFVFFYGAGCSSRNKKNFLSSLFKNVFKQADIQVEHDLLGAARAACGHQSGLAGILGTGSNCCAFDGKEITQSFSSGGYILGDEGGGVSIGKALIKALIEERLPDDLCKAFDLRYQLSSLDILNKIYKEAFPNQFLASFSQFTFHHRNHPFIADLLYQVFDAYFKLQVKRFDCPKDLALSLVGSVAFYYQEMIRNVAKDNGIRVGTILEKPISGLSLYHFPSLAD